MYPSVVPSLSRAVAVALDRSGVRRLDCAPAGAVTAAGALVGLFLLQTLLTPARCGTAVYPAVCGVFVLAATNSALGVALMPFLHGYAHHLLVNVVSILFFGSLFECRYGRFRFAFFFVSVAYLSTFGQLLWKLDRNLEPLAIGASGAAYGLAVAVGFRVVLAVATEVVGRYRSGELTTRSHWRGALAVETSEELLLGVAGVFALGFAAASYASLVPVDPRTATAAHFVGALFGLAHAWIYWLEGTA